MGGERKRATRAIARGAPAGDVAAVIGAGMSGAIPRVLRRRAAAPAGVEHTEARSDWTMRAPVPSARPAQLSPVELSRLTDHIVHTIDRRIAAFRERQGRV
jgi:hypothetical protein